MGSGRASGTGPAERTNTPREVVEAALAHTVQNPTEAAYARSDLFERRRRLMDDWAGIVKLPTSARFFSLGAERPSLGQPAHVTSSH